MRKTISRRTALKTGAAIVGASFIGGRASAAEFSMKYGNDLPAAHPINTRAREAVEAIKAATNGRLDIKLFPNSQLGADDRPVQPGALGRDRHLHHRLADRERGADRRHHRHRLRLHVLRPGLGRHGRQSRRPYPQGDHTVNLIPLEKMWDNGFRQITNSNKPINQPERPQRHEDPRAGEPAVTSMFKALGTSPTAINFVEVYSALQTKVVDGQENPLALIETAKFYEVQKFCSLTNHMWEGFWMVANHRSWERLPDDLRPPRSACNEGAVKQRADMAKLNATLEGELKSRG